MSTVDGTGTGTGTGAGSSELSDLSTGQLLVKLSEQISALVREEMQLAKVELQESVKRAGIGAGLFGAAGLVALYGGGALVATLILVLAIWLDAWLAALIVTAALFVVAGVVALLGKRKVSQVAPPLSATQESVKLDVATVKERGSR